MKIKGSSTIMWYGSSGGGIGAKAAKTGGARGMGRSTGQASYGASGFGSGGTATKGRKSPTPAPSPPRRRP